jgi:hypothetical protein
MPNTWSDERPQQRENRLAMPEPGELRCPNEHDSSVPPRHPALIFVACHHYGTDATWNEFCITCGARHEPYMIYRDFHRMDGKAVGPKNYCGYCGAQLVGGRASR